MKISAAGLILFASTTMLVSFTNNKPAPADKTITEKKGSALHTLFIHSIYTDIHQAGATLSDKRRHLHLPRPINKKIIESIKEGNCLFIYYPDQKYLSNARMLNG